MFLKFHSHITTANDISGNYQYVALHEGSSIQKQWHRNRHNLIKFLKFFLPTSKVLDAGCGSGNVVLEFAKDVSSITGIDSNRSCIDFLNRKIKEKKIKNARGIIADLLHLELVGGKFDRIIMTEVLEHFSEKDDKKILGQLKKLLNTNGKILITTPNYRSPWTLLEPLMDILHLSPKLWGDQHLIRFTSDKLIEILENNGFIIEKKGTLNFISPLIAMLDQSLADKLSYFEFSKISFGNLLYVIAVPKI